MRIIPSYPEAKLDTAAITVASQWDRIDQSRNLVKEAREKRTKAVNCPTCKPTDIELKKTIKQGETGWEADLARIMKTRSKNTQRIEIYCCKKCKERFQRPARGTS